MPKLFFMRPSGGSARAQVATSPSGTLVITGPAEAVLIRYQVAGSSIWVSLNPASDLPHDTGAAKVRIEVTPQPNDYEAHVPPDPPEVWEFSTDGMTIIASPSVPTPTILPGDGSATVTA